MRIVHIAAGAGGSYCGACNHDVALVQGLRARGHDVLLCPLYTPLHTDVQAPDSTGIFYGGINTWLQQHVRIFRRTPRLIDWLFDRPLLLKAVSRRAIETRPENLGDMTVSVLRGADGLQRKELERLITFLKAGARPDVVNLTNSLLSALAPPIREQLRVPVVCALQGEESFIARLPHAHRSEAVKLIRSNAEAVGLFIAPYAGYAEEMAEFLAVPRERIRVVRPGIDLAHYRSSGRRPREPFRIGFLSRVSHSKGIDILCQAWILLERECPGSVLAIAGRTKGAGKEFWARLRARLAGAGLATRLEYAGEPDLEGKARFLSSCSVFCLPSRFPERRGTAVLEAMASGLPVVLPELGIYKELVDMSGGGMLVPPEDPPALADALAALRHDPQAADAMGKNAREGVARHFGADAMVEETLAAYQTIVS